MSTKQSSKRMAPAKYAAWDHRYVWHPFTQMNDWLKREPIVIRSGLGALLWDTRGREYLDANSSIWTNLHGHRRLEIDRAIQRQLGKIAHCSALGLANEPASLLARELIGHANVAGSKRARGPDLTKVFFSDDGSTAMEAALKMAHAHARRSLGFKRPRFLSLAGAYHGDTVGAVSLGHIDLFHEPFRGLLFRADQVMTPYCYRCPFNRAKPERQDARLGRRCGWECVTKIEAAFENRRRRGEGYAGFVFEPLLQGAAGMIAQPEGWLARAAAVVRGHGAMLVADEVMTGFGRVNRGTKLFGCQQEGVRPDFMVLAKGLTGGYLPMAATLTTDAVFGSFLGEFEEQRAFYHGHSYTANPLGAAASLASLRLLKKNQPHAASRRHMLAAVMRSELEALWALPEVGDIRQAGLVAGVELMQDWRRRKPFDPRRRTGARVTATMAELGVLTRPIGDVVVLMPPYCATADQVRTMVRVLAQAIQWVRNEKETKN